MAARLISTEVLDNLRCIHTYDWDGQRIDSYESSMDSRDILSLFGLKPGQAIPPKFSAERMIGNVKVTILPKTSPKGSARKRVWATCPDCGKQVCAGHLHQHRKVCK